MLIPRSIPKYDDIKRLAKRIPEVDPSAVEAILCTMRVVSETTAVFEHHFAQYGLSEGRFTVMMLLYRSIHLEEERGPVSPADLAERAGVTRATITGLLDHLEGAGYIRREPRSDDRRMITVHLTVEGTRLLERILPGHFRRMAALFSGLSEDERKQLVRLMGKLERGVSDIRAKSEEE